MGNFVNFVLIYHSYLLNPKILPRKDTCDHATRRVKSVKSMIVGLERRTPNKEKSLDFYKKKCQELEVICNDCYNTLYGKKD